MLGDGSGTNGGGIFGRFLNIENCQPEAASDVISGLATQDVGMYVCAKLGDSKLKTSEASYSVVFSNVDNFRLEVDDGDIISSVVIDPNGVKVRVKFGDSRLNRSRGTRLPHFVKNDNDDTGIRWSSHNHTTGNSKW